MSFILSTLEPFQTVLAPTVKTSNVQFYKNPNAGSRLGSAINAPFTRAGAGRKVIDANGNLVDVAANVPAWTFPIGGSSAGCPYLSFLPSVENLLTYSEQFDNAAWTKTNVSITANDTTSPDGTASADLITIDSSTGEHTLLQIQSVTSSQSYTKSFFVKYNGSNSWVQIAAGSALGNGYANFNIELGYKGTASGLDDSGIVDIGNGYYYIYATATAISTTPSGFFLSFLEEDTATNTPSFAGNGTDSFYAWGAMLKEGSYISPLDYIPTEASAVTRAQDSITNISDLQGDGYLNSTTEGTIMFQTGIVGSPDVIINRFQFAFSSLVKMSFVYITGLDGFELRDNIGAADVSGLVEPNYRIVMIYSSTSISIYINGFLAASAAGDYSINQFLNASTSGSIGQDFKMLNFSPTALTASEAEAASSWPSFDLMVSDLGYS